MSKKFPLKHSIRILLQERSLAYQLMRIGIRKLILRPIDYRRNDNKCRPPIQIGLKVTNRCNMRCVMCAQWGESGYHLDKEKKSPIQQEVPFDVYKKMINEVAPYKPSFYIWGGEPFLYKGTFDILAELSRLKLTSTLVTNAVTLTDNAKEIVEKGLSILFISLDGPEHVHDKVRNYKGAFEKVVNGIKEVNKYKKLMNKKKPYISLFFTICKDNIDYMYETFKLIENFGIDFVFGFYSWFTSDALGNKHTEFMKNTFDCEAKSWKGYVYNYNKIDYQKVQEQIKRLQKEKLNYPYTFLPNLSDDQIERYYKDSSETFNYKKCYYPWLVTEIQPNGDVATCRDYPDYIAGNISKDSLIDIFNNDNYVKFREEIRKGLFPICGRCCGLMGL